MTQTEKKRESKDSTISVKDNEISILIEGEPAERRLSKADRNGRVFLSSYTKEKINEITQKFNDETQNKWDLTGNFYVDVEFSFKTGRTSDRGTYCERKNMDMLSDLVLSSLKGSAFRSKKQVIGSGFKKIWGTENYTRIIIERI